jgi:IS4 transposase
MSRAALSGNSSGRRVQDNRNRGAHHLSISIPYPTIYALFTLPFLTNNNFELPALTMAELYRCRWQVGLLVKWIKQHLRIEAFVGTSENAVKTRVWDS